MPQELHVVRCYSCKTFQVQIVKKVPKWQCKMCNEKQSVLKVYARGNGKDCRQFVQDLNMQQGLLSQETSNNIPDSSIPTVEEQYLPDESNLSFSNKVGSKWGKYLEMEESRTEFHQYPEAGEDQSVEFPTVHPLRGDLTYKESCQPRSQAIPNSLCGLGASDTLQNINVNQRNINYQTSHCSSAASNSSGSKWSQFVSQGEEKISTSVGQRNLGSLEDHNTEGKAGPRNTAVVKNPFCTTDDNLDTLLDF